jgi:hypothetical protein
MRPATRLLPAAAVLASLGLAPRAIGDEPRDTARAPLIERDAAADAAVERGLEWLRQQQNADGSWNCAVGYKLNRSYKTERLGSHVGASGLAGMAFLANGHVPGRGRYGAVVGRCVDYLLSRVNESGYITDNHSRMYSHAFAGLFLAEVYGMTHRADIREALKRVVNLLVAAQQQNEHGGWRYDPVSKDADLSITVCQLQLLRAAHHAGIRVPVETVRNAQVYVNRCMQESPDGEKRFFYQDTPGSRYTYALTAAGIVSLYSSGDWNHRELRRSVDLLWQIHEGGEGEDEPYGSFSYFYGHYYGVQAFYQDGRYWTRFFRDLRKEIVANQLPDGSWRDHVDPAYATAMGCVILSIPNGYLPIFQR